jgi:hypothetical protein
LSFLDNNRLNTDRWQKKWIAKATVKRVLYRTDQSGNRLSRVFQLLTKMSGQEKTMVNVYIEARPNGRPEGSAIRDYVVEDHANHELNTFKTESTGYGRRDSRTHRNLPSRATPRAIMRLATSGR